MQTVKYKEYEGYQVVTGFDVLRIDPVATGVRVKEIMHREGLPKQIKVAKERLAALWPQYEPAKKAPPPALENWQSDYDRATELNTKAHRMLIARVRKLRDQEVIYMPVRRGEMKLSSKDIKVLRERAKKLRHNEALLVNSDVIPSMIGTEYYLREKGNLIKHTIKHLGVNLPTGARTINQLELTELLELKSAEERSRVNQLSIEQCASEKQATLEIIQVRAVSVRSRYEIEGMEPKEALDLSRKWYNKEIKKMEVKYK